MDVGRQGDGCGHSPSAHLRGGGRGNRRTESCCRASTSLGSSGGIGTELPCKDISVHQAQVSGSQTPRAEPQLELKHVFTLAGNSEDIFSPPQMLLLIC